MPQLTDAQLRALIRQQAAPLLKDENITSVGIGYKVKEGKNTGQLCVQFTVGTKFEIEDLTAHATTAIPTSFTVEGVELPTDVIERSFEPSYKIVEAQAKTDRKVRRDPMQPGISIGHPKITAGTLGCVVQDKQTREPLLLSNWHVLHGKDGKLGDTIVQPGAFDDNRVDQNAAGILVRSFLGLAGDCAVARVSGRGIEPTIIDLATSVRTLGEPELGDRVVKSGRTTDVTYGVVTRIHTISRINYSVGPQDIGGFEIGPDPEHPALGNEISQGGDSGSAWMAVDGDTVTEVMLGLHFAGESGGADEYALACYATSVFEKLEVEPLTTQEADAEVVATGFDSDFLSFSVPFPEPGTPEVQKDLVPIHQGTIRHYTHFSLTMSKSRRFARWVAWNIDGSRLRRESRSGISFRKDPQVDADFQVGNEVYANNRLDRGHIARRADLVWGTAAEAQQANRDSFYFTNITPQLDDFNQSGSGGVWGQLENAIYEDVKVENLRLSVMGGPIFKGTDFLYRQVLIPRSFWKLLAYVDESSSKMTVRAFVLTQDDLEGKLESLGLDEFKVFEVTIADLEARTSLDFGALKNFAPAPESLGETNVRHIRSRHDL